MQRRQAYVYELMPDGAQRRAMRRFEGSCRFAFNRALALQQQRLAAGAKRLGYAALCKELTAWRAAPATAWLAETHSQVLQQALKDLERAYRNFFEQRAQRPRFRKKGRDDSFRFPQGVKLDQANSCPKLWWLSYRNSREVLGAVKNVTVRHAGGKWLVSIQTEREVPAPAHPASSSIGIDLGIARFATLSDGSFIAPRASFKRHQGRLATAQRAMSRKTKFSNNWKRAKARVQRIHRDIGNARRDFLHKASTTISQNHALVCIEELQVRNMSGSAAGTAESPGRSVRAKAALNRAILDQGWNELRRQLAYKQAWRGGWLIAVPPQRTSQTCPACAHVGADNRKTQARFHCVACGYENHADLVAAVNIRNRGIEHLAAGHAVSACGGSVQSGAPVKQEPTEATRREVLHA